jgi:hypothetical protein
VATLMLTVGTQPLFTAALSCANYQAIDGTFYARHIRDDGSSGFSRTDADLGVLYRRVENNFLSHRRQLEIAGLSDVSHAGGGITSSSICRSAAPSMK